MFTALTCSRTLLFFVLSMPQFRKPNLFCPGLTTVRTLGAPCMKLNIIKKRVLWWSISGLVILVGIGAMALSWQQFGAPPAARA